MLVRVMMMVLAMIRHRDDDDGKYDDDDHHYCYLYDCYDFGDGDNEEFARCYDGNACIYGNEERNDDIIGS